MPTVYVRAYEELNDFLPPQNRKRTFGLDLSEGATVSQLLADLEIPPSAVDLVLAGDASVGLSHRILDGERISIYPVFEAFDIAGITEVRTHPLRSTRFLADRSLKQVGACLRLLGFDTEVAEYPGLDPETLRRAEAGRRILLTQRNTDAAQIAMSRILFVSAENPHEQLLEILSRLDLHRSVARHSWEVNPNEAVALQRQLRLEVVTRDAIRTVRFIGGADLAFDQDDAAATAVVAVLSFPELELCESSTVRVRLRFPYLPGLLSFREAPPILEAIGKLRCTPDLLLCDGHGYAHPRRFGLACHIGVLSGIPTIGVAKKLLVGSHGDLPLERGAFAPLVDGDETIGAVVRTRAGVKPVYVSVGNRISLGTAVDYVLRCSRYRLPEPARWADHLARKHVAAETCR